jgi:hypothetical protein
MATTRATLHYLFRQLIRMNKSARGQSTHSKKRKRLHFQHHSKFVDDQQNICFQLVVIVDTEPFGSLQAMGVLGEDL